MLIYIFAHVVFKTRVSNFFLLLASLIFYSFGEGVYLLLLLFSIGLNYLFGLGIASKNESISRASLIIGVAANVLLLVYFKYLSFMISNINFFGSLFQFGELSDPGTRLPIGISFFTFQAISYLVDIHRRDAIVQRNPIDLGLFIAMFPQLIAGPIVRYQSVDAQIRNRKLELGAMVSGFRLFAVGLFMKVVIADSMALVVDKVLTAPIPELSTATAWVFVLCYSLQIFFDFAGYSLMAIGLGRSMGFTFPQNFNQPYISRSIKEFWRRWHISLSSWFRDYLYIPLGGSRKGKFRTYLSLFIVFFTTGIWHGASWNFVVWGFIHGAFIIIERSPVGRLLDHLPNIVRHLYVLLIVCTAWVFFRLDSFTDAFTVVGKMYSVDKGGHPAYADLHYLLDPWSILIATLGLAWAFCPHRLAARFFNAIPVGTNTRDTLFSLFAFLLFLGTLAFVITNTYSAFIYFRF